MPQAALAGSAEPHRATALTPAQQRIIDQGNEVGQYARQQFPDGQLIEGSGAEAMQATQKAIATGATCLFEAAFSFDGLFVRCDILHKVSATTWSLLEVKSSSKVKDEHHWDAAVQKYVLSGVGLSISATKLMHINTQTCVFPDLTNLLRSQTLPQRSIASCQKYPSDWSNSEQP
jgi:hypothetical protein